MTLRVSDSTEPADSHDRDPFALPSEPDRRELALALRGVEEVTIGTAAPASVSREAALALRKAQALLAPYSLEAAPAQGWADAERILGTRTLLPRPTDVRMDEHRLTASVTFSSFYAGGNGAVHGGAIPLLFDHLLGALAHRVGPRCRTAYLRVDYRNVTPVRRPLRAEAWIERVEGRKRFARGVLRDGETVTCEVDSLFVELRPGQP